MRRFLRRILPLPLGIRFFPVHGAPLVSNDPPLLRLAHLCDLHFTMSKNSRYPAGPVILRHAVSALNAKKLDGVLFTGDLFDLPSQLSEDAPLFAEIMRGLRHPWYVALGNHDVLGRRAARRRTFLADTLGDRGLSVAGTAWYSMPLSPGIQLIVIDTTDNGKSDYDTWQGHFSEQQARWLDCTLNELREHLVIIAAHHPPATPYPFMRSLKFQERDKQRLAAVLARHPQARTLICGHFHLASCLPFGPARVLAGPALIEHPHGFRILEVRPEYRAIGFDIHWVSLTQADEMLCTEGPGMLLSRMLGHLSCARTGHLPYHHQTREKSG
ncbi:MAG: metallophosphoesterase [Cyanobacteria bacterium NC_groundwater_1444_Ag_S-0.65um_54_12]|nr:metallophosphoesterase [Cyanobacteria bacterium NC_groundwater_1444_Ag_S-0.65um_54_12]